MFHLIRGSCTTVAIITTITIGCDLLLTAVRPYNRLHSRLCYGITPLDAVWLRLPIEAGDVIDENNSNGFAPTQLACLFAVADALKILIAAGAGSMSGTTSMHWSVSALD